MDEAATLEATRRLLAVTGGDADLARRLLPFFGVIREDLQGLPVVILPGALYVTESPLRKNTGTHYTPRDLAEKVVEGALEPLLYHVGPLQTADRSQWKPKSSQEILGLKVADIAMGSAAFLVAAARYLGDALVDAWVREEDEDALKYRARAGDHATDADADPVVVGARRQIIEHCLYGADINPMAVEMAKLSLWLVSMHRDLKLPFTFVDDRLVVGDALLGITSLEQLEYMHMDPARGRKVHEAIFDWTAGVRVKVAELAESRREIAEIELGDDPLGALARKRSRLADAEVASAQLRLFADLAVGGALAREIYDVTAPDLDVDGGRGRYGSTAEGWKVSADVASIKAAEFADAVSRRAEGAEVKARIQLRRWLALDQADGSLDRRPIHWPLIFPEVFAERAGGGSKESGDTLVRPRPGGPGFDAVIGNPPFLGGQKLTGSLGVAYREYLVEAIGRGTRGSADLVAYFVLRAHDLLNATGQTGLIATNTLAQGDTREVGLDQIMAEGATIHRAVKSGSSNLAGV
ncbi:Eco57I restriction-modification methylase domain-containing protein [Planomonospora sp. ID82291]|uniref:Eco57I restriction-modification methylase domain-containing protein n=1 Tax=Planomonospora sp. ID82291 TaxID=2738136 RepID=UPI0027DB062C|nr:DNA methyltransferase [Planomonospora sp. ID82291]